jgi:hypothetical protein
MVELNVCGTTGTNAEWSARILLSAGVIVAAIINKSNSCFPFVNTRFTVAARVNRKEKDMYREY